MNTALELTGVALAALLSENLLLVSSMGIGTHTESFQKPQEALRTGASLTLVMVLAALCAWPLNYFVLVRFGMEHFRLLAFSLLIPGLAAALRAFFRTCIPELSRRIDGHLASISTNCAALGSARRRGGHAGPGQLRQPPGRGGPGPLSQVLPGRSHPADYRRPDGNGPDGLLRPLPGLTEAGLFPPKSKKSLYQR